MATDRRQGNGWSDPLVRVVVVTFSPGEHLDNCLSSLKEALTAPFEVILVDNGSTDGAPERAQVDYGVDLLSTGTNLGYGGAANLGASGANAPWLLVVNPDVRFSPGSIDRLLEAAQRWPGAGALGPAILTSDGRLYPSARALPSLGRGIGHALLGWWWPRNPWTAAYRREREQPVEGVTGWLSGACLLMRREAFESVGGFDPEYFMYFEDLDLCERMARAGQGVVYVPSAVITHEGGHATSRELRRMSAAHHDSAFRYLSRRYPEPWHAPLRTALKVGLGVRYLLSTRVLRVAHGAQPARAGTDLKRDSAPFAPPPPSATRPSPTPVRSAATERERKS